MCSKYVIILTLFLKMKIISTLYQLKHLLYIKIVKYILNKLGNLNVCYEESHNQIRTYDVGN